MNVDVSIEPGMTPRSSWRARMAPLRALPSPLTRLSVGLGGGTALRVRGESSDRPRAARRFGRRRRRRRVVGGAIDCCRIGAGEENRTPVLSLGKSPSLIRRTPANLSGRSASRRTSATHRERTRMRHECAMAWKAHDADVLASPISQSRKRGSVSQCTWSAKASSFRFELSRSSRSSTYLPIVDRPLGRLRSAVKIKPE